jgi:hypothetical protein
VRHFGVVRAALRQLYIRPRQGAPRFKQETRILNRSRTRPADTAHQPAMRESRHGRVPPAATPSSDHRLGLQHRDAIRNSASQSVPIGDDIHGAQAPKHRADRGARVVRRGDTHVYVNPVPYGYRRSHRLSRKERDWANYRYFGGRPSRYGHGRFDAYADPGLYGYGDGDLFRFGFMKGYDVGRFDRFNDERTTSLLAYARSQLNRGVELFHQGRYAEASDAFQVSADTDQGDAVSRIYAGHALFALGRYRDAAVHIRRAMALQPRIVYLHYNMRDDYDRPEQFDAQLNALEHALDLSPANEDRLFLLGYVLYFSDQRSQAYPILARAYKQDRRDTLVRKMMRNAQPPDVELDAMKRQRTGRSE